jgi:hypothetical protein
MKWGRHVARMWRRGLYIGFWREKQNERGYWEELD